MISILFFWLSVEKYDDCACLVYKILTHVVFIFHLFICSFFPSTGMPCYIFPPHTKHIGSCYSNYPLSSGNEYVEWLAVLSVSVFFSIHTNFTVIWKIFEDNIVIFMSAYFFMLVIDVSCSYLFHDVSVFFIEGCWSFRCRLGCIFEELWIISYLANCDMLFDFDCLVHSQ